MCKELTIVIPFLNEGVEVEKTVGSVQRTAAASPDIILINDGSTDGYGYRAVAEGYGCRYVEHGERRGVAASRDEGVALAETPYILLLDAHMEMYGEGWDRRVGQLLAANPRAVLCSQTQPLTAAREKKGAPRSFGAHFDFTDGVNVRWSYRDAHPNIPVCEVEAVLGAAYAFRKEYYERLHGLRGLQGYGADEELLSLKVRREGGQCLLVKDWVTGHIYRNGGSPPFARSSVDACYNRLLIAELFFEGEAKDKVLCGLRKRYGGSYAGAARMLGERGDFVASERENLNKLKGKN
jgi:glycosyltransferase involved in cell wall biosynthesis